MDVTYSVQCPPFNIELSHWDKRMGPLYSMRTLCFPLSYNTDEHKNHIAQFLFEALQSTVEALPFLAGSVVPFSKDKPWLYKLHPEGSAHLEVKDLSSTMNYQDLRKASFSPSLLNSELLCPYPKAICTREGPVDCCRLRANFVKGGLLLVISIVHTVCDGRGITEVLKVFAEMFRKSQSGELIGRSIGEEKTPKSIYSDDRASVLSGNGHLGTIENHPAWDTLPYKIRAGSAKQKTSCIIFHIRSDLLALLKQTATPSPKVAPPALRISTHDAIAALIWRSIMLARRRAGIISDRISSQFCTAVDCRSRLSLPTPYFGNAIYAIATGLPMPQLAPASDIAPALELQYAAYKIRQKVNGVTGDTLRDLLAFAERTQEESNIRLSVWDDVLVRSLLLISYFGFEMHGLDFGDALGGKIEAFRLPSGGLLPGMPVVLPRLPDGSCEFVVNDEEEVIKFLREDEVFRQFASERC